MRLILFSVDQVAAAFRFGGAIPPAEEGQLLLRPRPLRLALAQGRREGEESPRKGNSQGSDKVHHVTHSLSVCFLSRACR